MRRCRGSGGQAERAQRSYSRVECARETKISLLIASGRAVRSGGDGWEAFFSIYADAIQRRRAAIFVGAGLSFGAGLPSWTDLVWTLVENEFKLEREPDLPLPSLAQYVVNRDPEGKHRLHEYLHARLASRTAKPTEAHDVLPSLGLDLLWTSNYDDLIERAYRRPQVPHALDVMVSGDDLSRDADRGEAVLFKLHGTLSDPASIVITRQDYARYRARNEAIYVALLNDLLRRRFLFLGFSFTDPNVLAVLDHAARLDVVDEAERLARDRPRRHFAIFREDELATVASRLRIQDLELLGIETLLVSSWDEIPTRLEELRHRLLRKHILVSGSARHQPEDEEHLRRFSEKLGRMLIEEGYTIVCGFNPAVGRPAINGALEALHERGQRQDAIRRILMWPLPTGQGDSRSERDAIRGRYREEMTSVSGIGIFLGGGSGTRYESASLREKGGRLVPIGASGGVAHELWCEMRSAVAEELRQDFDLLGTSSLDDPRLLDALRRLLSSPKLSV